MINRQDMLDAARRLPPEERAGLVKDIWDSLAGDSDALKLSVEQERELDLCWQEYLNDPTAGDDWASTKAYPRGAQVRGRPVRVQC